MKRRETKGQSFISGYTLYICCSFEVHGVSSQKDDMQSRVEQSQSKLSHRDIRRKTLSPKRMIPSVGERTWEGKLLNGNYHKKHSCNSQRRDDPSESYFHWDKAVVFLGGGGWWTRHHLTPNSVSAQEKTKCLWCYYVSFIIFLFVHFWQLPLWTLG